MRLRSWRPDLTIVAVLATGLLVGCGDSGGLGHGPFFFPTDGGTQPDVVVVSPDASGPPTVGMWGPAGSGGTTGGGTTGGGTTGGGTTGGTTGGGTTGGGTTGGGTTGGTSAGCDACINDAAGAGGSCDAPVQACQTSADCIDLNTCIQPCDPADDACINDCAAQYADGVAPLNEVLTCLDGACATECGGTGGGGTTGGGTTGGGTTGGGTTGGGTTGSTAACDACVADASSVGGTCDRQVSTCQAEPDCLDLNDCIQPCTSDACVQTCADQFPAGVNPLVDVFDCLDAACTGTCPAQ